MLDIVKRLERWISLTLIVMMSVVVVLATIELGITLVEDILAPPVLMPGIEKLLDIFSRFLLVLIGVELIETIRSFTHEGVVRLEVVLTVAMIALARKVIVLEVGSVPALSLVGLASLIASLALGYFAFVRRRGPREVEKPVPPAPE